jgi:5-aminopentanamidase
MKVAAYQAPLASPSVEASLALLRDQVDRCESLGVEILCCPEGVLGGLADYTDHPFDNAIDVEGAAFQKTVQFLASDPVTTIVGFTEMDRSGRLFNAAAVLSRGAVVGVYRKCHPAIHRSVYHAGTEAPVFTVGSLTFGVIICLDSRFPEPAAAMASQGATAFFIPTNNGMPPAKGGAELPAEARAIDIARAIEYRMPVVRADVAGETSNLVSYGSSGIVGCDGRVLAVGRQLQADLLVAEIDAGPGARPQPDSSDQRWTSDL